MRNVTAGSPASIFFKCLDRVERHLKRAERPRAFKDLAVANALRTEVFKLEGWAKIHRHWPQDQERKVFQQIRHQAKELEDALGSIDVAKVIAADLRDKHQPAIAELFDHQAKKAQKHLKEILRDRTWLDRDEHETPVVVEPRIEKMRRLLESVDWPGMDLQFDTLRAAIVTDLHALSEKYRSTIKPVLMGDRYDRKILDNSLHDLRRQLRWFSMYFQTADGLFALGPVAKMLTVEKKKLIETYSDNPFSHLPEKKTTRVLIDRIAFYDLTRLIDELGRVKDRAEKYFHVREALLENGSSDEEASAKVRALYGDVPIEVPAETKPILAEMDRFKPLAYLAESLQ